MTVPRDRNFDKIRREFVRGISVEILLFILLVHVFGWVLGVGIYFGVAFLAIFAIFPLVVWWAERKMSRLRPYDDDTSS